jgi:hypothetical protein
MISVFYAIGEWSKNRHNNNYDNTLGDNKFRKQLLVAAEIVGSTITYKGKSHYLLADYAIVGEAIILALKTTKQ